MTHSRQPDRTDPGRGTVLGWEELELEVVRDAKNQKITVCFIENIDAMGLHTDDFFCSGPMLTISPVLLV